MAIFNITNSPGSPGVFNSWITDIQSSHDGDLLVYGNFTTYNNVSANNIIKIDYSGNIQTDFNYGVGFTGGFASAQTGMAVDSIGDIYLGGQFNTYQGNVRKNIVKINADGSDDITFVTGSGINNFSLRPLILPGGDVIYVGIGSVYNGTVMNRLMKISPLGIIDSAYNTNVGAGFNDTSIQAMNAGAGVIYVHGYFTSYNGTVTNHLAKINADGTLDASFSTNIGLGPNNSGPNNYMSSILDNSGKIIIVGAFTSFNGNAVGHIARINSDGTFDSTFNNGGSGFNNRPYDIKYDSVNDKVIVLGSTISTYNGTPIGEVIVLDNTGALDTNFNYINSAGYSPDIAKRADGNWYIALNNYSTNKYYIVKVDDNGNKVFI